MSNANAADVVSLFNRLGVEDGGAYHTFDDTQPLKPVLADTARRPEATPARGAAQTPVATPVAIQIPGAVQTPVARPALHGAAALLQGGRQASVDIPGLGTLNLSLSAPQADAAAALAHVPRVVVHSPHGGAGVTTLAVGLAAKLASAGWSPLILDLAGSGDMRLHFERIDDHDLADTALMHAAPLQREVALYTAAADGDGSMTHPGLSRRGEQVCASLLEQQGGRGFMIFDLPASAHPLWRRSLDAADVNLVVLRPDARALDTVERLLGEFDARAARAQFVLNHFDPADAAHRQVEARLRELLGGQLAQWAILHDPAFGAALLERRSLHAPLFGSAGFQALCAHSALAALNRTPRS